MKRNILWALLVAGLVLAGTLFGMDTPSAMAADPVAAGLQERTPGEPPEGIERDGRHFRGERAGPKLHLELVRATVQETGMSEAAVIDTLQAGQTVAEVAEANGSSGDAVVAVVVTKAQERLDEMVENGRITQERADRLIEIVEERATDLANDPEFGTHINNQLERQARRTLVHATADETSLSFREIIERVRNGETIEEIAISGGSSAEAVVNQAAALVEERMGHAVDAERITQAELDAWLAELRETAERIVDEPWEEPVGR